jgi:hypothetical protein
MSGRWRGRRGCADSKNGYLSRQAIDAPDRRAILEFEDTPRRENKHVNRKGWAAIGLGLYAAATCADARATELSARTIVEKRIAAVARHDLEAIVALYAPDAVETSPGFCSSRTGAEGVRRTYGELFQAYPNISDDVVAYVVDGHHVAVQFVARVRKADGSLAFEVPIANFLTVEHGRISRDDTYFDTKGRPCT